MQSTPPAPKTHTEILRDLGRPERREAQATLSEVFTETVIDAAPVGFVLARLGPVGKPILWTQDRLSRRETGRPYLAGLPEGTEILHLEVSRPLDALWAMEEGLRCPSLGAVIGEIWGDPAVLDFTATKRLALRAEAHRVPAWIIRRAATAGLSAARDRWRVKSLPALPEPDDLRAPGEPLWQAERFRSRWSRTGTWVARPQATGLILEHGLAANEAPALQQRA